MPRETLSPAAVGLLTVIQVAADLVDKVGSEPRDANSVDLALDALGDIATRVATDELLSKIERGEF